jgi:hypothetical protein
MSQHDFNIANQGFPATRADLNNALQALASNSSGDAEPSTTFANQWWYETDTNTLKLRNEANNAWLSFATVDQSTAAWTLAHDVDITGTLTSDGLTVDGGTIKLNGNYPVGSGNVALGNVALASLTSGTLNTAVGEGALTTNNEGTGNAAFGRDALTLNTTGAWNVGIGINALQENTTGSNNVAIGQSALVSSIAASNNTVVGYQAGYTNEAGQYNTFVGRQAGYTGTGSENTGLGQQALYGLTTGGSNTAIGTSSGSLITSGSNNTIIGAYNGNQGSLDIRTSSNNVVLSDGGGNPRLYFTGGSWYIPSAALFSPYIYSTTGAGAGSVVVGTDGNLFRSSSSARYKTNIVDASFSLSDLMLLRPVNYTGIGAADTDKKLGGLIAEEVHDAGLSEFVIYDNQDRPDALHYSNMVSLCIKAIQEQQATITALTARITALEGN